MEDRIRPIDEAAPEGSRRNLLTIFRRRIWVMVPVALLVLVLVGAYAAVQPRMYQSEAWMLISMSHGESPRGQGAGILTEADVYQSLQSDIAMHVRLIRRTDIAQTIRDDLELETPPQILVNNLAVEKVPGASANLISLVYRSESPELSQSIVNRWAELYEQDSQERSTLSVGNAIGYVEEQLAGVEEDLRTVEEQMGMLEQEYLDEGVSVGSTDGGSRITGLIDQLGQNEMEIQSLRAQIDRTLERLESEPEELEEVTTEPSARARALEQQLSELHVELQDKLQDYYPDSPEVRALQEQIAGLERTLEVEDMTRSEITTAANPVYQNAQDTLVQLYGNLDAARARGEALQNRLAEQRGLQRLVPEGNVQYHELARRAAGLQAVHATLLGRLYDLRLDKATAVPPVQTVRQADTPGSVIGPGYQSIAGVGILAALLLAALAAVLVDQLDDTFANPEEIRSTLHARLVGVLPEIKGGMQQLHIGIENGSSQSAFANAARMLASTVRIEMARRNAKSLTITSCGRAEGKTLIASNLAAALAGSGEKVLLIDCDLHRSRVHTVFDVDREPGLTHLLVGEAKPADVIRPTPIDNLSIITAGPLPPSPVDLLASTHGNEIIEELSAYADYVLWDTPPAGFLPDATVVAHETDALLFVVGAQARRSAARESLSNLRESGANVIGVAANRVAPMGGSYYYYYYYYYDDYGQGKEAAKA